MRVALNEILKNQFGEPFASPRSNKTNGFIPLTLWELAETALYLECREPLEGMEKRVALARKIHGVEEPIELGSQEIDLIKTLIAESCNLPLIVVQSGEILSREG